MECQALLDWFLLLLATTGLVWGRGGLILDWFWEAGGTTGLDALRAKRNWCRCTIGLNTLSGKQPCSLCIVAYIPNGVKWRADKAAIQTKGRTTRIQTILSTEIEKSGLYPKITTSSKSNFWFLTFVFWFCQTKCPNSDKL